MWSNVKEQIQIKVNWKMWPNTDKGQLERCDQIR